MKTASLTTKNRLTIPVALLKLRAIAPGTKFTMSWQGTDLVLTPVRKLGDVVTAANEALAPLIARPLNDQKLQENLREWPKGSA